MTEGKRLRQVKSFVKREGRLTPGQQKALDFLWPKFGIEADGQQIDMAGVGQLLKAIEENHLTNLRVACTDAVELLKNQIADNALERVQLYFPDPWHKKRHHKRRIIQPAFVDVLAHKIHPGGFLHMATDWQDYAEQMLQDLSASSDFINTSITGDYIPRPEFRPLTKFEQRGHRLGHGVWDLLFQRR